MQINSCIIFSCIVSALAITYPPPQWENDQRKLFAGGQAEHFSKQDLLMHCFQAIATLIYHNIYTLLFLMIQGMVTGKSCSKHVNYIGEFLSLAISSLWACKMELFFNMR